MLNVLYILCVTVQYEKLTKCEVETKIKSINGTFLKKTNALRIKIYQDVEI